MRAALALPALLLSFACAAETPKVSFEEKLLATVPADHNTQRAATPGAPTFTASWSPDGKRAAWVGVGERTAFVVVDGKKGEEVSYAGGLVFSPDGKHVAWLSSYGGWAGTPEKWWVTLDGKKLGDFDLAGPPRFSPDSSQVAYFGNAGSKRAADGGIGGGKWFAVIGDKRGADFEATSAYIDPPWFRGAPVWSPDGKQLAYVRHPANYTESVVAGATTTEDYDAADQPVWSPDGRQAAWAAVKDNRWWVFLNGQKLGGESDHASVPVFSPDGKTLAWKASTNAGKQSVMVAGKRVGGEYDALGTPVFSPDGREVAFAANTGAPPNANPVVLYRGDDVHVTQGIWKAVVGGREGEAFERVESIVYAPNGKVVAYRARKDGRWLVVAGASKSDAFDEIGPPAFSPDGKKVAFGARKGLEIWWKVMPVK
ncbi:MAG: PD40 domain-containing protein [Planctomycetia bacterium]|nr:PD40 domain-containing protein [Planctomycetia bacterium]